MTQIIKKIQGLKPPQLAHCEARPADELRSRTTHIIGFEFDGTASFRKGTVNGPDAIRAVADGIESYSPYLDRDTTEINEFLDIGNLPVGMGENVDVNWQEATNFFFEMIKDINLKESGVKFLTLGGEHSISYAPIVSSLRSYPDMVLLHLDAHADLRDGYLGHHYSHASIIRRCLDHFEEGHELIQYGVRSGTQEEYAWMKKHKTLRTSFQQFIDDIEKIDPKRPIYLTLDLDYFDPCYMPGTGTPEPGGETFHSFVKLIKILDKKNFVGCDVVELSPELDSSGNSDVFATKVVRELLLILDQRSL